MHPVFITPSPAGPLKALLSFLFQNSGVLLRNGRQCLLHLLAHAGDEVHVVVHTLRHTAVQLQLHLLLFAPRVQGVLGFVIAAHGAAGETVLQAERNTQGGERPPWVRTRLNRIHSPYR